MNAPTVAIIDPFHPAILETIKQALPEGWRLSEAPEMTTKGRTIALAEADMTFMMAARMTPDLLDAAPRLKFIQKMGAGVDNIDLDHCRAAGITVARLQAGNAIPVAEHTIMMILAATRQLITLDARTRAGHWDKEAARGANRHLTGKVVGIIGLGAIGRRVARMLAGFEVTTIYCDPIPAPETMAAELGLRRVDLDAVIEHADIITLHVPLKSDTRGFINAERIAAMKPDAVLINCARGGLVDETALAAALAEGRLFGAGLDAFSAEPPGDSPLLALENTVVSPHCAGATLDNFASIVARAIDNAEAYLADRPLPPGDAVIDPRKLMEAN